MVSRRRAADSAVARQGEGNNDKIALEMELGQTPNRIGSARSRNSPYACARRHVANVCKLLIPFPNQLCLGDESQTVL